MSNVPALIKEATERYQCRMVLAGEKVKLRAPAPLPDDLLERLRRHKAEVIEHLAKARIMAAIPILLARRPDHELTAARQAVLAFLDNHLEAARHIGWADLELFGCHPRAGRNRYDYMGAVTLAAISGDLIERITELAAHYENGLVYYRKRPMPADAVPVWELGKGS